MASEAQRRRRRVQRARQRNQAAPNSGNQRGRQSNNLGIPRTRRAIKRNTLAGAIGSVADAAGSLLPAPFGTLAKAAGGLVNRIFGRGDYVINSAVNNSLMGSQPPSFARLSKPTTITHTEFVGNVTSSTTFASSMYSINPGMPGLFPWLKSIANNWEQYRLVGFAAEFKSTSGFALSGTNTALGTVGMTTLYDPADANLTSRLYAENYGGTTSGPPSSSLLHFVECARESTPQDIKYLRSSNLPSGNDIKEYDMGNLCVWTEGMPAAGTIIGGLWVTYHVELLKPLLGASSSVANSVARYDHFKYTNCSSTASTGGMMFGYNTDFPHYTPIGNLGSYTQYVGAKEHQVVLPTSSTAPAGRYLLNAHWYGDGQAGAYAPGFITLTNGNRVNVYNGGYGSTLAPSFGGATPASGGSQGLSVMMLLDWPRNGDLLIKFTTGWIFANSICDIMLIKVDDAFGEEQVEPESPIAVTVNFPRNKISDEIEFEEFKDEPYQRRKESHITTQTEVVDDIDTLKRQVADLSKKILDISQTH